MKGTGPRIYSAKCVYCGKKVFSMYEKQLEHNIEQHETHCPIRLDEEKNKKEVK